MDIDHYAQVLWDGLQQGEHFPAPLQGKLSLESGYRVQLAVLDKWMAAGEEQAGWKLAFTADGPRKMFGSDGPAHGYLLKKAQRPAGFRFDFDTLTAPAVEAELIMTLHTALEGPGVTAEQVRGAVASICPGFEIIERRGDMAGDLPLGIADDIFQSAYVGGKTVSPFPASFSPEKIMVEIRRNGEIFKRSRGAEVIDNHFTSIAFLANQLAGYERRVEPGQLILTGSFIPPTAAEKGDHWEAHYEGIGEVDVFFD